MPKSAKKEKQKTGKSVNSLCLELVHALALKDVAKADKCLANIIRTNIREKIKKADETTNLF